MKRRARLRSLARAVGVLPGMPHLGMYRLIAADVPWEHENYGQAKHGAAKAIYDEMPLASLEEMPVGALAHPDGALLFLWCTGPQAAEGGHLRLARAWGFRLVTRVFAWVKTARRCVACEHPFEEHDEPVTSGRVAAGACDRSGCECPAFAAAADFGTGSYTGGNVEDVWLGVRGDTPWSSSRARRDLRQVVFAPPGRHSAKPEAVQDRIEALWPDATPRLELFARRRRPGWACWGNEAPGCDLVFGAEIGTTWPVPGVGEGPAPAAHAEGGAGAGGDGAEGAEAVAATA